MTPASPPFHRAWLGSSGAGKPNYVCVDTVRFWSMLAIIAVHSLTSGDFPSPERRTQNLQLILLQAVKFGTIGFYFISGFLLGQRLDEGSAHTYFLRRLQRVGAPWALWASLFAFLPFTKRIMFHPLSMRDAPAFARQLGHRVLDVLFFSPYWFIPNFLLALAFLLLCRRYWNDSRFGAALLCLSLFYGVNIYQHWIPAHHTTAVGGFVFYLWLGHWASRHQNVVFGFLERIQGWQLLLAAFCAGSLALAETGFLRKYGSGEIVNTLRISNQAFSLVVIAGLMKVPGVTWPRFIDVRRSTFGLFLIHPVVGLVLCRLVGITCAGKIGIARDSFLGFGTGIWVHLGLWTATFLVSYGGSLGLTQVLATRPPLAWTVGQRPGRNAAGETRIPAGPEVWVS